MATTTAPQLQPGPRRGRAATHDPEALLDLVEQVARSAVCAAETILAEHVSMPAFNRVKLDVDRARGLADPRRDSERTPTADAIQMRFKELAGRPIPWHELVAVALRPPERQTMWLAALRREEARDDLTDAVVTHALRRVAHERSVDTLAAREYVETRDALVAADRERYGDDGLLEWVLPTGNQVLSFCGLDWKKALRLAGLRPRAAAAPARHGRRPRLTAIAGMPLAQAVAMYAAINGHWPSYPGLLHFATACGVRMQDKPPGGMGDIRAQAAELLTAEGVEPPTRPRGGGKGKRLTYRYPMAGIPGAPLRDPDDRRQQLVANPRLAELRRELAVLSLRVWLASLTANEKRTRAQYLSWQVGTGWTSASGLDAFGGFAAIKREATRENDRARREHRTDVPGDVLARPEAIRAEVEAIYAAAQARQPEPVPFGEALRAVLTGPHAVGHPPRQ